MKLHPNLRFVAGPDGCVWYDPSGKAQGQAVDVNLEDLPDDMSSGELAKVLNATVPEDLMERIKNQTIKRFFSGLSMAKKSGALVVGTDNVLEGLYRGRIRKVLVAENAGKDLKSKLERYNDRCTCLMHTNVYDEALGGSNIAVVGLTDLSRVQPLLKEIKILKYYV